MKIIAYQKEYDSQLRNMIVDELLCRYPGTVQSCNDDFESYTMFLCINTSGDVVGCCGYVVQSDSVAELRRLFVSSIQRQYEKSNKIPNQDKVSYKLYNFIESEIKKRGVSNITLTTSNPIAVRFYERQGFLTDDIQLTSSLFISVSMSKRI